MELGVICLSRAFYLEELSSSERWPGFHLDGFCTHVACTLLGRMFYMARPAGKENCSLLCVMCCWSCLAPGYLEHNTQALRGHSVSGIRCFQDDRVGSLS